MTKYNWGIIGTGWIAHEMADALQAVKGEIYAAANPNEISLKKFAAEKNIKHLFTSPDEMIQDPNINIIYIILESLLGWFLMTWIFSMIKLRNHY